MEFSADQLAQILGGKIDGNPEVKVSSLSKIEEGKPGSISFLSNPDYNEYIYTSKASIVIVNDSFEAEKEFVSKPTLIRVDDARMAFAKLLDAYQQYKNNLSGIHPSAIIEESAEIGVNVYIGPLTYVAKGAKIGDNTKIRANCVIGENVVVGENTLLHYNVTINEECLIGSHCTIQPGAVIGGDGFGFQPNQENNYHKVPHIGNVILEDHVEIGANTTIDRATLGSTIIRKGVKLDNLIQVAHNVEIDQNTVIASQTGVAGSVYIGKNCMVGGQVGFAGHQRIADGTKIAAQSGIAKDIKKEDGIFQGSPALPIGDYKRSFILFKNLPDMNDELSALKKEIELLKKELASK